MKFINEILYDKKVNDIDCTEDESAYIKGWLRDTIIKPEDGSQQVLEDIQLHFPLEYSEYLGEIEEPLHESLTRSAKIGIAGFNEDGRVVSVTMQEQQSNSVVSIEDAANSHAKLVWGVYVDDVDKDANDTRGGLSKKDFKAGANWQKEQYNSLLNSYRELLEMVKTVQPFFQEDAPIGTAIENALKQSNNILKQFNQ